MPQQVISVGKQLVLFVWGVCSVSFHERLADVKIVLLLHHRSLQQGGRDTESCCFNPWLACYITCHHFTLLRVSYLLDTLSAASASSCLLDSSIKQSLNLCLLLKVHSLSALVTSSPWCPRQMIIGGRWSQLVERQAWPPSATWSPVQYVRQVMNSVHRCTIFAMVTIAVG